MIGIIKLLRPHQWLKNVFLFLPVFFGNQIMDLQRLLPTIIAFVAFSFLSSSVYCFNDIQDCELDKLHPEKRKRPIASGNISIRTAYIVMILSYFISSAILLYPGFYEVFYIALIYYVVNILYCVKLKNVALVDIFIVSSGFVLRLFAGGVASGIELSKWIILMTFLLSLFLAFSKRLDDSRIYVKKLVKMRRNISSYTPEFIQLSLAIICAITIVCYIMYTVDDSVIERVSNDNLYMTSVFVLLGMLRFLQLAVVEMKSSSPTKILIKDYFIQMCIILWVLAFIMILYV
ncbi:MAG: decaprenyl-phosphate phosphoribosyltransferase [Bacteroidales bacterium]|nr:decaprenyl-phosphate phosphoribosyltransferase [Bacteroidales bacterium]